MTNLYRLFLIWAVSLLTACGGGGGSSGSSGFGGGGGTTGGGTAADLELILSSNVIPNSLDATVTATAVAVDSNRNAVKDVQVIITVDSGAVATVSGTQTDAEGKLTATVGIGSSTTPRTITVTATSGSLKKTATLQVQQGTGTVVATDLDLILSTDIIANTGSATITATAVATDAKRNALAGAPVFITVDNGAVATVSSAQTDATGSVTATIGIGSNTTPRVITVTATSGSLKKTATLQVQQGNGAVVATDLDLILSAGIISNTGSATITATAVATDAKRNALAGAPVSITVDNGAVATVSAAQTDATGSVKATIGIGSNTAPRIITITATSGTIKRTAQLQVQEGAGAGAVPTLTMALSNSSISSASPATVTVTLRDAKNLPIAGQVVTFAVVRGLAVTNVATTLTRTDGSGVVVLAPSSSTGAGADEVTASASVGGVRLNAVAGFTVQATNVNISSFDSAVASLGAYGQTSLMLGLNGASVGSPVQVTVTSACVTAGKAALSPSRFTATTATVTLQYRDIGCGAILASDTLQAVIDGSASTRSLSLPIASPVVASLAFISSTPEQIYLKGSGFVESSSIVFEVRDVNSSPLPNVNVSMRLLSLVGGVTMESGTADVVRASDTQGRVTVRVNSGSLPTPVRVAATIVGTSISTVSSNLSVAVGLPSQLNFSLSQGAKNIEGYNIDGTTNTYQIIAADRSGNPIPAGTSINFVTEGGQIEAIKQTQLVSGIARTQANFVSSEPRPVDGRVTITAYALGEESFLDRNGNNQRDADEPFQDLGNIYKDRLFDGLFDAAVDEYIPLAINNSAACVAPASDLLLLDPSMPSMPSTCDGVWSGAGQVYVRRAAETVLSTSSARPLWANTSGLSSTCSKITLQVGPDPSTTAEFTLVAGDTWYGNSSGTLSFIVADANPGSAARGLRPRLNPMAAGTVISASTPTQGLSVTVGGGSPVPSTTEASFASVAYGFALDSGSTGVVFVNFRSPSGLTTTVAVNVDRGTPKPSACPP